MWLDIIYSNEYMFICYYYHSQYLNNSLSNYSQLYINWKESTTQNREYWQLGKLLVINEEEIISKISVSREGISAATELEKYMREWAIESRKKIVNVLIMEMIFIIS